MDYFLNPQPIYNFLKQPINKNKIIYKYKLSEDNKDSHYLIHNNRNHIFKLNSYSHLLHSKPVVKPKKNFPLINLKKNFTIADNLIKIENINNLNNNLKLQKRYQSKDDIIGTSFLHSNKTRNLNIKINNTLISNTSVRDSLNDINNSYFKSKKNRLFLESILKDNKKPELKLIKLRKISNDYRKNILKGSESIKIEPKKTSDISDNEIKFNLDSDNEHDTKLVLGSKYSTYELTPEPKYKNAYYSRLNTYNNKINQTPTPGIKNKKLFLKLDLKKIQNQKLNKYKKLVYKASKEETKFKKDCLIWVNQLREKYSDLYNGLGISSDDKI